MASKFGIKIYFPDGEWLWATQGDSKFHLAPLLFDTKEAAQEYALTVWGDLAIVESYHESERI